MKRIPILLLLLLSCVSALRAQQGPPPGLYAVTEYEPGTEEELPPLGIGQNSWFLLEPEGVYCWVYPMLDVEGIEYLEYGRWEPIKSGFSTGDIVYYSIYEEGGPAWGEFSEDVEFLLSWEFEARTETLPYPFFNKQKGRWEHRLREVTAYYFEDEGDMAYRFIAFDWKLDGLFSTLGNFEKMGFQPGTYVAERLDLPEMEGAKWTEVYTEAGLLYSADNLTDPDEQPLFQDFSLWRVRNDTLFLTRSVSRVWLPESDGYDKWTGQEPDSLIYSLEKLPEPEGCWEVAELSHEPGSTPAKFRMCPEDKKRKKKK